MARVAQNGTLGLFRQLRQGNEGSQSLPSCPPRTRPQKYPWFVPQPHPGEGSSQRTLGAAWAAPVESLERLRALPLVDMIADLVVANGDVLYWVDKPGSRVFVERLLNVHSTEAKGPGYLCRARRGHLGLAAHSTFRRSNRWALGRASGAAGRPRSGRA